MEIVSFSSGKPIRNTITTNFGMCLHRTASLLTFGPLTFPAVPCLVDTPWFGRLPVGYRAEDGRHAFSR